MTDISIYSDRTPEKDAELTLDQIKALIASLPGDFVAYWVIDGKMKILAYARQILTSFDVTAEAFEAATARDALDVVLASDRDYVYSTVDSKPVGPEEIDCVFRLLHMTRGFFWVHSKSRIIGTYQGGTVCLTNYLNTDAETEIFREIVDLSDVSIIVTDRQSHEILYMNRNAQEDGQDPVEAWTPVHLCYEYLYGRSSVCENCPITDLEENGLFDEDRYEADEGSWYHVNIRRITWQGHDAAVSFIRDITDEKTATEALHESERRYQIATQSADILVWEYDPHTHCIDSREGGMAYLDAPDHIENVPQSILHQFREEDRERAIAFFKAVDEGQPTMTADFWMKGGENRAPYCMRFHYTNVFDESGEAIKAYAIGQDVTTYKEDEGQYDQFLKNLLFTNTEAIGAFHINLTRNTCGSGVSPTTYIGDFQQSGTYDGFIESSSHIIADDEDLRYYLEHYKRTSLLRLFEQGETDISHIFHDHMESGEIHPIETIVNMKRNPRTGDIEGVIYSYDLNERLLQEEIIQHITNVEFDFVGLIDVFARTLAFRFVNSITEIMHQGQVMDYDNEFLPSSEHYVVAEERRESCQRVSIEELIRQLDESGTFVFTYSQPDGDDILRKQLEYSWFDRKRGIILVIKSDVTQTFLQEQMQRRQVESALAEAQDANEAKSAFLSNVSHDMRTPLNGIMGFTDFALKTDDIALKQRYLKNIRTSSTLLKSLVDDTLDLSKIESGSYALKPAVYRSHTLINDVSVAISANAVAKGVTYIEDFSHARDGYVFIDILADQKIFLNLLSNAVKFTPPGGKVTLRVVDTPTLPDGTNARITVSDTGIGMSPEFLSRAFEPFAQENDDGTGTGLGLAIAARLVKLMGGHIEVESTKNVGTTFTVCLPMKWVDDKDGSLGPSRYHTGTSSEEDTSTSGQADLTGMTVLLVEDNDMNIEIAQTLLERRGVTVISANNGREGVELFSDSAPGMFDAILMDIRMPIMNGYDATRAIRALDRPDAATVRIIAMSADAYETDIAKSRMAGMDAHIAKPVMPAKLYEEVALARKR